MSDNDRGFALGPDPLPTQHYIDMRDAIIAGLKQDIATLQSQLQSVTDERDAAIRERDTVIRNDTAWTDARIQQRAVSAALMAKTIAERDAARQSRARLVRLVRALPVRWSYQTSEELSMAWNDLDAARAWAAAWRVSAHYWKAQQKFTGYAWAWTDGKIGGDEYFERTDKVRDWMYANVPAFVLERIDKRLSDNLRRDADARRAAEAMERR